MADEILKPGIQYNKDRYDRQEYNRWGIDETLTLDFTGEVEFPFPFGERYISNERNLSFDIDASDITSTDRNEANERNLGFDIECEVDIDIDYTKFLDLLPLVPEKFRSSETLQDYLKSVGLYVGAWLSKIDEIKYLIDPYNVDPDYVQYLADLIGLPLVHSEPALEELRNQLALAIPWYKIKGSYTSLKFIAHLLNFTVNIYDMYTNNYTTFVKEPWFVGEEGENPPGLDATYYKSPHFGLEVLLNIVYGSGSDIYLWSDIQHVDIRTVTEYVRPVNTVPHFSLLLNPITNESGAVVTADGYIRTCIDRTNWETVFLYFDQWWLGGDPMDCTCYNKRQYNEILGEYNGQGTNKGWNFDDGHNFDSFNQTFLNKIIKYKIGTGNKGVSPGAPGFVIASPVLFGTVTDKRIFSDRIEFEFVIPENVVQLGLSELGLFFADNTTMVLESTFPDIDKLEGDELRVLIQVYKQ
jgi:hypothetical protein